MRIQWNDLVTVSVVMTKFSILKSTQNTNTLCGQNVGFLNVKLVVNIVTTGLQGVFSFKWQSQLVPCVTFILETSQDVDLVWCLLRSLSSFHLYPHSSLV